MKVFVSWSGELSRKVAEILHKELPCILQSIDVFYSGEDIEKGKRWNEVISKELLECNYGIICLTSDNLTAPWLNFEAGALSKTLDARVSALMINVLPSDIQGPIKSYQATSLEKEEIFKLMCSINKSNDAPISEDKLRRTFDPIWNRMDKEIRETLDVAKSCIQTINDPRFDEVKESVAIEEILRLVREQYKLLSSLEQLPPRSYLNDVARLDKYTMSDRICIEGILEELETIAYYILGDETVSSKITKSIKKIIEYIRCLEISPINLQHIVKIEAILNRYMAKDILDKGREWI